MEYNKILVPVSGSPADNGAISLACRLAKRVKDKGKILAVFIVAIKRALPIDAEVDSEIKRAEDVLDRVQNIAEEEEFQIETDVLQAREIGSAIVDEAVERGMDLILMGITYSRPFGQFSLGNVVPYVLKNSPCPVILYQQ
jgi:nucleotide-binding universal stress UspA family protein